jgi:hypothetical protein
MQKEGAQLFTTTLSVANSESIQVEISSENAKSVREDCKPNGRKSRSNLAFGECLIRFSTTKTTPNLILPP